MNLIFRSHHTAIPDDLRVHAERKLARLDRMLPRIDEVTIEFEQEETRAAALRHRVHVTVHSAASVLRGDERASEPRVALERAIGVVVRQAQRHTKRLHERHRSTDGKEYANAVANAPVEAAPADEEVPEYLAGKIVRAKTFEAKPMSQEEALAQMDLLGHDFFLFLDASTREFALLYKRKDGDYGLLTPQRG